MKQTRRKNCPLLVFSGNRANDHYFVEFCGQRVALTHATLNALIDLAIARSREGTGYLALDPVTVRRLRLALKSVGGRRVRSFVETGCGQEYRLALDPGELPDSIHIQPDFVELVAAGAISTAQADQLLALSRQARLRLKKQAR